MGEKSGSPSRTYVVLEQLEFEDTGDVYFVEALKVQARNAENALRKAFKEMRANGHDAADAKLLPVPESMWRPTTVRAAVREQVSVTVG